MWLKIHIYFVFESEWGRKSNRKRASGWENREKRRKTSFIVGTERTVALKFSTVFVARWNTRISIVRAFQFRGDTDQWLHVCVYVCENEWASERTIPRGKLCGVCVCTFRSEIGLRCSLAFHESARHCGSVRTCAKCHAIWKCLHVTVRTRTRASVSERESESQSVEKWKRAKSSMDETYEAEVQAIPFKKHIQTHTHTRRCNEVGKTCSLESPKANQILICRHLRECSSDSLFVFPRSQFAVSVYFVKIADDLANFQPTAF